MTTDNERLRTKLQWIIESVESLNPNADEARRVFLVVEDIMHSRDEELKLYLVKQVGDRIRQDKERS
jgi:hypothetical protein